MLGSRSRASSPGRRRLLALSRRRFHRRDRGGFNRLGFVPDRGLELSESLAQRSACVGEPLGPEEYERDAEQDDQVGGLEKSGEHESCPSWGGDPAALADVVGSGLRAGALGGAGAAARASCMSVLKNFCD